MLLDGLYQYGSVYHILYLSGTPTSHIQVGLSTFRKNNDVATSS